MKEPDEKAPDEKAPDEKEPEWHKAKSNSRGREEEEDIVKRRGVVIYTKARFTFYFYHLTITNPLLLVI